MKALYLDCSSGISGDMTVAALLDVGASREKLESVLASLPVSGFRVKVGRVLKSGIDCCDFDVVLDHGNHDHDMAYLHGGEPGYDFGQDGHGHGNGETGGGACRDEQARDNPAHTHHAHEHRGLADILGIIDASSATPRAKELAKRIFDIVAQAESKAHGVPVEQVHFHEVGAVDSIVDVLSTAVCFDDLGVDECIVSCINEGTGTVRTQHGILSIPVPAVVNIVEQQGLTVSIMDGVKGEFVTPTGAAIAAALRTGDHLPPEFKVLRSGTGAGKRTYERPSVLRAFIIEPQGGRASGPASQAPVRSDLAAPHLWKLETEVDDCSAEALGFLLDHLYRAGAREAHFVPVFMKKNRPGYQVEVLCDEGLIPDLERIFFEDTTTIGVRRTPLWRTALQREASTVDTEFGQVKVKKVVLPSGDVRAYPEHDSVARIARERGVGYQDVLRAVFRGQ